MEISYIICDTKRYNFCVFMFIFKKFYRIREFLWLAYRCNGKKSIKRFHKKEVYIQQNAMFIINYIY